MGLADVSRRAWLAVIDGHWGLLFRKHRWFKDDKDLTHLPEQKPKQNKGHPKWKTPAFSSPGLSWLRWFPKAVPWVFSGHHRLARILASRSARSASAEEVPHGSLPV